MVQITIEQALKIGIDHHTAGRLPEAENAYRQVLAAQPTHWHAMLLLGLIAHQTRQNAAALQLIEQSISINPNCESHHYLGTVCSSLAEFDRAKIAFQEAIRLKPDSFPAYFSLSKLFIGLKRFEEASAICRQAIEVMPDQAEAHVALGDAMDALSRLDEAAAAYSQALSIRPLFLEARFKLGNVYNGQKKYELALASFAQALQIDPNFARTHHNIGEVYRNMGKFDEALAATNRAIAIDPMLPESLLNRGNVLSALGRWEEAIRAYQDAIGINPTGAELHWNLADALLVNGRLQEGWKEFEWRLKIPSRNLNRGFSRPQWDGSDPGGKTILLHTEGGFGDAFHFIRLVPMLQDRNAKFILECQPSLVTLFIDIAGIEQIVPRGKSLPPYDLQVPLQSLPGILGISTLEDIPSSVPYLAAPPDRVAAWALRLAGYKKRKVGLVWAGSVYADDTERRSRSADVFLPLTRVKGVQFFSLQKGPGACEKPPVELNVIDFTCELHDWADTGAFVQNLDLVISVDTSVAHLAGALAKPVWVLIPRFNDFRWLLVRTDSPWYPTMRLFRQKTAGTWTDVIEEMARELTGLVATSASHD